jgi:subtilisin family serine protease
MIQLAAPPMAEWLALATVNAAAMEGTRLAAQAYLANIETAQQDVLHYLNELAVPVLYRTQRVYNGIAVRATAEQVAELRALPGVAAVHRIVPKEPDNAVTVPLIGAYSLWQGGDLPAVRGEDIRIAVIDTGVDYHHVTFGGSGAGYALNDPTRGDDAEDFPGFKVVGGYDFAGDDYDADERGAGTSAIPQPDGDPLDCYGHGTHVAGTAAGYGVTSAGTTYRGPYDDGVHTTSFRIGPGVAPMAQLFALKIFGCSGSSDLTDLAIEWAVDPNGDGDFSDRVDVINMSLGAPYGAVYDTTAVAADNAAALGVIVVASAGNSRDRAYAVGAPSVAVRAISVAASQRNDAGTTVANTPANAAVSLASFSSRGPRRGDALLKPDLAAPGVNIFSALNGSTLSGVLDRGSQGVTLSGTSMAAPHVAGAMALLRQLHPTWSAEELKALAMNTALPMLYPGNLVTPTLYSPAAVGAGEIDLWAASRSTSLLANATVPGAVALSFGTPSVVERLTAAGQVRLVNRGGAPQTYRLGYANATDMGGVEIVAPAAPITVPAGSSVTGTVLMQADAAQMGAGRDTTLSGGTTFPRSTFGEETGYLLAWPEDNRSEAILEVTTVADNAPIAVGAAWFHFDPAAATLQYTIEVAPDLPSTIWDVSLAYVNNRADDGLRLSPIDTSAAMTLSAKITGNLALPPQFQLWLASDLLEVVARAADGATPDVGVTARGRLRAQTPVPRIPVYAAPRAVADTHALPETLVVAAGAGTPFTLTLTNRAQVSLPATGTLPLVSALELQLRSPNGRPASLAAQEPDHYDRADLAYVGVTTAASGPLLPGNQAAGEDWLYFGVATHAPWSTPNELRVTVDIDVDDDLEPDFRLSNGDEQGYNVETPASDAFVSVLQNLATRIRMIQAPLNAASAGEADTRPFGSRVMVLPVRLADLGLTGMSVSLHYTVTTYSQDLDEGETPVDVSPRLTYWLGSPLLDFAGSAPRPPLFADVPGQTVNVIVGAPPAADRAGVLLLHHHNDPERQVEVIPVVVVWPHNLFLPQVAR